MMMNTYKLISALAVTVSSTALFVAAANPAFAQQGTSGPEAEAKEATGINAIIVTGTRRTDRTVADSTVPVDVISGDELLNSGTTETNTAGALISQQFININTCTHLLVCCIPRQGAFLD